MKIITFTSKYVHFFCAVLLLILSLVLYGELFFNYIFSGIVGGWDGTSHLAITTNYSNNIFPNITGWVSHYYSGMPFPNFYPPLFYFLNALISHVLSIDIEMVFRVGIISLLVTFPLVMYRASFLISRSNIAAVIVGIITTIFLGYSSEFGGTSAISLLASLNSGLVTQLLGAWLLFIWLPYVINRESDNLSDNLISVCLLALIALSNAHILQITILIIVVCFLFDFFSVKEKKSTFFFYLKYGATAFGLASFWYVPLLLDYGYATTKTLKNYLTLSYPIWFMVFLLVFLGISFILFYQLKKERQLKLGYALLGLFILIFPIATIFPGLPLQPSRSMPILFLLIVILISYALVYLVIHHTKKQYHVIIFALFIVPFLFGYQKQPEYLGTYPIQQGDKILKVVEYLGDKEDARSMVEVIISTIPPRIEEENLISDSDQMFIPSLDEWYQPKIGADYFEQLPDHYLTAALLGMKNHQTIWTVFRESSINSIFTQPLRNSFSLDFEDYGTVCYLCSLKEALAFRDADIETKIKRARLFNLGYFVVRQESQYEYFNSYPDYFTEVFSADGWYVFKLNELGEYAHILEYKPSLVFTELKTKHRPIDGYDWLRLHEHWFKRGDTDSILIKNKGFIENHEHLERFSSLVLFEYPYASLEDAFDILLQYVNNGGTLILYPSSDELFLRLQAIDSPKVITLDNTQKASSVVAEALAKVSEHQIAINTKAQVIEVHMEGEKIHMVIENNDDEVLPIYISSSYFPSWESQTGEELWMGSPVFTVVFSDQKELALMYKHRNFFGLSIVSLLLVMFLGVKKIIRNKKKIKKFLC